MAPRSDATGPTGLPDLELDVRAAPAPKPKPRQEPAPETPLELAVDPGALVRERSLATVPSQPIVSPHREASIVPTPDTATDASLLADYGAPPRHWLLSPLYAWRVLRRRRELKAALAGRREEAARATSEAEDALIAFGERVRPIAEKAPTYAPAFEELRKAEAMLRSRDRVLA